MIEEQNEKKNMRSSEARNLNTTMSPIMEARLKHVAKELGTTSDAIVSAAFSMFPNLPSNEAIKLAFNLALEHADERIRARRSEYYTSRPEMQEFLLALQFTPNSAES